MDTYTQPDYDRMALITIDVQNDFSLPGAVLEIKGTYEIIPKIAKIVRVFRTHRWRIIHVIRLYKENGSNADISRRMKIEHGLRAVVPDSEGAELVKALKPNDTMLDANGLLHGGIQEIASNEYMMYKSRWGAFYNTPLEKFLRENGITTLIFTGCNFPNCPRTSIYEASERDFKLVAIEDAISGIYDKGITELRNIGCHLTTTADFLYELT
jgi:nicotinamidase-related amidase